MKKTTITFLMMMIICLSAVSAYTWNRWTPSPTTDDLKEVASTDNGKAYAIKSGSDKCFLFNGVDEWHETFCANDSLALSDYRYVGSNNNLQKVGNKIIMLYTYYDHSISNTTKVISYDTSSETYTEESSIDILLRNDASYYVDNYLCLERSGYCIAQSNLNHSIYKIYPSFSFVALPPVAKNVNDGIMTSNFLILYTKNSASPVYTYEWNNFSWIDRSVGTGLNPNQQHIYVSSSERYLMSTDMVAKFNTTSGKFSNAYNMTGYSIAAYPTEFIIEDHLFGYNSTDFATLYLANNQKSTSMSKVTGISNLSYNPTSGLGWAVGSGGIIYYLLGISTTSFNFERGISPNPSVLGSDAVFWTKPTLSNSPATILVEIYDSSGDYVYSWQWDNVPTSYNATNTIESFIWNNFAIGTYSVIYTVTDHANNVQVFNDSWVINSGGFNITGLSVNSPTQNVCVNRTLVFNINANISSGTTLRYDFSCYGNKYPLTADGYTNEFMCEFNNVQNYTVYGYAFNSLTGHEGAYQTANITLNVSLCTGNYTIMGRVVDFDTGVPVVGAVVTLSDGQTTTADINGNAFFIVPNRTERSVYITKEEYYPIYYSASTYGNPDWYLTSLTSPTEGGRTSLKITTISTTGALLNNSLVTLLEPITGQTQSGITNSIGEYTFISSIYGDRILITASNEPYYVTTQDYIQINYGGYYSKTIILENKTRIGVYYGNSRFCVDAVKGVLLCGNLSVTGSGSDCLIDADCISDRCMPSKTCSNFNWTVCDVHGLTRGQYCFARSVAEGGLTGVMNFIFGFFIFVLVILFLIGIVILLRKRH